VATWDDDYIPRNDFLGRGSEAVAQMVSDTPEVRWHRDGQTTEWQKHTGWDSAETGQPGGGEHLRSPWNMPGEDEQPGGADPGEGSCRDRRDCPTHGRPKWLATVRG
jgi:hypothetical protein